MITMSAHRTAELLLFIFALTIPFTRLVGGLNLATFFIATLILSLKIYNKQSLPRSLLALCIIAVFYITFSLAGVLPRGWTRYFEVTAIPQQALFAYAMPTTIITLLFYLKSELTTTEGKRALAVKLAATWAFLILLPLVFSNKNESDEFPMISISGMGTVTSIIIVATALHLSTISKVINRIGILAIFVLLSFLSPFSQNKLFAVLFAAIWILPKHAAKICIATITLSLAIYLFAYSQPMAVQGIDQNLSVRLVLLKDAISGLLESNLIGVGFGTEAISNYYSIFFNPEFRDEEDSGFIHLAHHNSFATIAFRMGIAGLVLLLYFSYKTLRQAITKGPQNEMAVKCSMFLAFFIVCFVNPALESFVYLYGVCFYLAVIWSFREQKSPAKQ